MYDSPYPTEIREYLYKILVIGDVGTGKTSIIKRYVHNIFSVNYKSTVSALLLSPSSSRSPLPCSFFYVIASFAG